MDISRWLCLVCLPVCSFFTVGALLIITGLLGFAVSIYLEQHPDSTDPAFSGEVKSASFALLIAGAVFLVVMIIMILCSKIQRRPKRDIYRANEQWRDAMLRLIEEANVTHPMPRVFVPPPPPSPSEVSSSDVTPPPCYMETPPPSYDVAVGQLAGVHLPIKHDECNSEETSSKDVQNDR